MAAVLVLALAPATARGATPRLTTRAAIVVEAETGGVIWERNADEPLPPASTTKVVTAIVALESGRLDESFRVSRYAAETPPSQIGLVTGQRMRLRHLLYAVLLNSANDAAVVVAEGLGGSDIRFARQMNGRAAELGATSSQFLNPHGLTEPGHRASARDLVVLFRHALQLPGFREILSTRRVEVPLEAPERRWISLRSHNRLLSGYTYSVIGKTGYTRAAGRCFVGAASDGQREVIIALLGSRDLWGDSRRLIEFALGEEEVPPVVVTAGPQSPRGLTPRTVTVRPTRGTPAPVRVATRSKPKTTAGTKVVRRTDSPPGARVEGDDHVVDGTRGNARFFAVQLGPYANRAATRAELAKLSKRGYTARAEGRMLKLGRFSTHARAKRFANRLRVSGYRPTIVSLH